MDNKYNNKGYRYQYSKREGNSKDITRPSQKETSKSKRDEDLIIEENTIYEIDRDCMERLKRNRRR